MVTTRADRFTDSDRKNELYSDFLINLNPHPVSGELLRVVNENAVTRSIKALLNTTRGERLFQPNIGSTIRNILFEPMYESTATVLSNSIRETISTYEPRAKVVQVQVIPDEENNRYVVGIVYLIINSTEPITINISLQRVR